MKEEIKQQAFPTVLRKGEKLIRVEGMTLRDYFAAKAIIAQPRFPRSLWQAIRWVFGFGYEASRFSEQDYAKRAYQMADAMLDARSSTLLRD